MKLLVTGGAGYVGSIVAQQLVDADHEVTVLDNLSTGHRWAIPDGAEFAHVDILDGGRLTPVVKRGFDAVLHFAALSLVAESASDPTRYLRANIVGALNLLDAMRAAGVGRLVFSSTAATYGEPDVVPIEETAPTRPTNAYGASKLAIDHAIGFEAAAHGLAGVSLRYFNVAGASGELGEAHHPETHLIPLVLRAAAGLRPDVKLFGTDYPTHDGSAVRDYIHIEDLGRAHLLALEHATTGPGHRIYNLGNGAGFSVREVIGAAERVTGRTISVEEVGRRPGDPAVLVASSKRIQDELGWRPEKAALESMVGDAWEWMSRNRDRLS
ncbi:MAG: UDP-glucose 4-epimerase GalE [Acidimicrobiia bacterium]|nr:UDP-glucose 4-epimerase GalE [Acidimicrobiia bacterium]